jgi:3'(2'), 5'-bisphosphate nucleotidase
MILNAAETTNIQHDVRAAGQYAKQLATQEFQVSEKGPDDFVTTVDRALDERLTQQFSQLFPQDGVITEENAASRLHFQGEFERLWCIDPLDGTKDFINGDRNYAVLVGLLQNKQPVAGWIYAPESDVMYYGGADLGVWKMQGGGQPQSCQGAALPDSGSYRMIIGDADFGNFGEAIRDSVPEIECVRSPGSFGLKVMQVVTGNAELYVYLNGRVKVWDSVSSVAIARAAGLVCCDLMGKPLGYEDELIDLESLAHQQTIVVGRESYVESLLPRLRAAIL